MYLPNKITNVLSKVSKSYVAEYNDGKITSVSVEDKDIKIEASSKGYCISIKGSNIHLDNLQGIEPLLIKMGATQKRGNLRKEPAIRDNLVELFSKKKNTFSVEYKLGKATAIKMKLPKLTIKKNSLGYLLSVNSESIAIDSLTSLKSLLQKMNVIEVDKTKEKVEENQGFEQLMLDLEL
ncbi:MAG: hypothetical protein ACRCXT_02620 [Paraclostridium sp.]